jgi:hypothetical protein
MKLIFENPQAYGFYIEDEDYYLPVPTHTVFVSDKVESWGDFANAQGISYKLLKYFNPWLRQTYLKNRKKKTYEITLPDAPYDITHVDLGFKIKK